MPEAKRLNGSGRNLGRRTFLAAAAAGSAAHLLGQAAGAPDPVLAAMQKELQRSMQLRIADTSPYFIEYFLEEGRQYAAAATLGGLYLSQGSPYRIPRVNVRVGSYSFDNTNSIYGGMVRGARYDSDTWPLENREEQIRRDFWLATDRTFKSAVESLSLKKAALKNVAQTELLSDFAKAKAPTVIRPLVTRQPDKAKGQDLARRTSAILQEFPQLLESRVDFTESYSNTYYVNSEGAMARVPELLVSLRVHFESLSPEGNVLRDALVWNVPTVEDLPPFGEIQVAVREAAKDFLAYCAAPKGEMYSGPVLFSGQAGPQLIGQLFAANLAPVRSPISEPGRPVNLPPSELEGRLGLRVLPDSFDVVDDPNAKNAAGRKLFGCYEVDLEGQVPEPVRIVEKGLFRSFLLTRQPVKNFEGSNGRARLPGAFGSNAASISNLLVRSSQTIPEGELKARLLELVKTQSRPYGILLRRLDFPTSAGLAELRRMAGALQGSGGGRIVAPPIRAYKVFPDGREEMVRDLRFRSLNIRSLRDVIAAGDQPHTLEFQLNSYPLAMLGAPGFVTGASVVAPSVLLEEVDLDTLPTERMKSPLVPPPAVSGL